MKIRGKKLKGRTRYTSSTKVRITMAFWKCEIKWLYNFLIHRTSFHYFVERIKTEKNSQWHFTPPAISECTPRELRYLLLELCPRLLVYFGCAAAESLQSCPTLCDPRDGSPPGSPGPGMLQARALEWAAISFSNAWKWSRSVVSDSSQPRGLQPTRLLRPWDFPGKSTGVGCHCLLHVDR